MVRCFLILFLCLMPTLSWAQLPQIAVLSTNADQVGLYEKFEAILLLQSTTYQNPYDPDQIDVRATFISPTGKIWEIFGFYDNYENRNQWKVRFSPNEIGTWKYTLKATDVNGTGSSQEYSFNAVASEYHGWLKVSPDNPHYLIHDDGTSFYGVGVAYPWGVNNGPTGLAQLEASGTNMFYYWNIMYETPATIIESMSSGLGRYDQAKCGRIDQILEWSEARGLKMMLSIWPHDLLSNTVWVHRWDQNPYNQICDVKEFYGSEQAWAYQEKQYRYLIARWGHSRSMGIWEIVCEINGTDGWLYGNKTVALNWVQKVYEFLKQNDPYGRPVTASQSGGLYWSDGYQIVDLPNVHLYETSWTPHYSADPLRSSLWIYGNIAQKLWQDFEKPGIFGEAGYLDNYGKFSAGSAEYIMMYHNALWVSWANGLAATPLWWDFGTKSIFTPELMAQLLAFSKVAKRVDYAHLALSPASLSVPDCDAYALKGDSVAFGWIRDIKGVNVSGKLFRLEGLPDAPYSITWFNTWAGDTIKTNSRLSQDGQLIDQIPRHLQNLSDIAFIVRPARSGDLPERLELMAYPTELYSDTSYTSQITCYILDAQGRICTQANNSVTFRLEGPGTLEGTNPAVPTNGMTKIIFRANRNAGTARIIASSSGLVADTLNIVVQKFLYIDDFEEYTSDADLQTVWQKRYGTDTEAFLESSIVGAGQKSMRLQYKIGDGSLTYAGISRPLVGDWSKARFLTFWLKPNDTGHRLTIRLYVDNTRYWYYFYSLTNSDSTTVTIPLKDFKANYSAPSLDPTALISMALNIDQGTGNWGSGILYFDNFNFLSTITDIETEYRQPMPRAFTLYPNYPNPFNNETIIRYALPGESLVQITVHNIQGQVIEVLVDKKQEAGIHEVRWNAKNIGSGVYFYRMKTREIVLVQKCVLVK